MLRHFGWAAWLNSENVSYLAQFKLILKSVWNWTLLVIFYSALKTIEI